MSKYIPHIPSKLNVYIKEDDNNAFAVDSENPKTNETAKSWAAGPYYRKEDTPHDVITVDNADLRVKFSHVGYRYRGKRLFRVEVQYGDHVGIHDMTVEAVNDMFCSNLDFDVKEGIVNVPFIWVRTGSALTLVAEGGDIHKEALEQQAENEKKASRENSPSISQLEPMTAYVRPSGATIFYVGPNMYVFDSSSLTFKKHNHVICEARLWSDGHNLYSPRGLKSKPKVVSKAADSAEFAKAYSAEVPNALSDGEWHEVWNTSHSSAAIIKVNELVFTEDEFSQFEFKIERVHSGRVYNRNYYDNIVKMRKK